MISTNSNDAVKTALNRDHPAAVQLNRYAAQGAQGATAAQAPTPHASFVRAPLASVPCPMAADVSSNTVAPPLPPTGTLLDTLTSMNQTLVHSNQQIRTCKEALDAVTAQWRAQRPDNCGGLAASPRPQPHEPNLHEQLQSAQKYIHRLEAKVLAQSQLLCDLLTELNALHETRPTEVLAKSAAAVPEEVLPHQVP